MHRKWGSSLSNDQQHQDQNNEDFSQLNLNINAPSSSFSNTNVGDHHVEPESDQGTNEQPQFYGSPASTSDDPRYQVVEPKKPVNYYSGFNTRSTTPVFLHIEAFKNRRRNPGEHDIHNKLINLVNQLDFFTIRNYIDVFIFPRTQWNVRCPSEVMNFKASQTLFRAHPLFEFPRSEKNVPRLSEIANFKATQRLDISSTQQPIQNPHHDDATVDQNADPDVPMVDQNAVSDNESDQQSNGAKAPKRKRKGKKSQASQAAARRKADKMKRQSQCAAFNVLSSTTPDTASKSQQPTPHQIRKMPKSRRPPTTAENRAEALKPKRPNTGFQVIADVTQTPKTVQDDVTQSSQIHQQTQQQSNINANVDSNVSLSTQIHQPTQQPVLQQNEDEDDVIVIDDIDYLGGSESTYDVPSFQRTTLKHNDLYNALSLELDSWASDMHIQAFHAAYIPHLSGTVFRRIAFLDPVWQQFPQRPIPSFLRMFPRNPDLIQCPLHIYGDHWGILSINVGQDIATWYDPLMQSWDSEMERVELDYCETILDALKREGIINDETILQIADYESFNQQRDGCSCGWHICIISEDIARDGYSTKWSRLQIIEERKRMYLILHRLHNVNSPTGAAPQTIPTWPELPPREYDADVQLSLTPQLSTQNDLIQQVAATAIVSQQQPKLPVRRSARIQAQHKEEHPDVTQAKINSLKKRCIPIARNSSEIFPQEHYLGPMDQRCKYCKAFLFRDETSNNCCAHGTVPVPKQPIEPYEYTALARHAAFWNNIRQLNALFRMVSVSANSTMTDGYYKLQGELRYGVGDLAPLPGQPHEFAQIYTMDADAAIAARLQDAQRFQIKANETDLKEIIKLIEHMLRNNNPLVKEFATMKDQLKRYEEKCEETGETPRKLFIVWEDPQNAGSGGTHPGRLNLPAQSGQVFSIYKTDDGEPPKKGLYFGIKAGGSNSIRQVPPWDAHVAPTTFPLIYLFGQHGWHPHMPKINPKNPNVVSTLQQQIQRATQQQPLSPLSSQWPDAPQSPTTAATSTPSQQQHTNPPPPLHQSRTSSASTQFLQRPSTTGAAPPTSTSPTAPQAQSVQQHPASSPLHLHIPATQQQQNHVVAADNSQNADLSLLHMLNAERAEEEIRLFLLRVQRMHQGGNPINLNSDIYDDDLDSLYNFILPSINSPKFGVYLSVGVKAPGLHDGMLVNYIHEQTTNIFFPNCSGNHFRMYRYNIATNELYFIDPIDNQNPPYTPYLRNIQTYLSQKFNVAQPVVHPHDPFVPAFVQQEGDSVNCGYFILALIEYFSKGFNPTQQHYNFNIYQYKQRCIQLFDYIINNRVVTLDALKQFAPLVVALPPALAPQNLDPTTPPPSPTTNVQTQQHISTTQITSFSQLQQPSQQPPLSPLSSQWPADDGATVETEIEDDDENFGQIDEDKVLSCSSDEEHEEVKRPYVSQAQFYRAIYCYDHTTREKKEVNLFNGSKKLFQEAITHALSSIEQQRLEHLEKIADENSLRYESSKVLRDHLERQMGKDPAFRGKKLGKVKLMTPRFRGGARYMHKKFRNGVAITSKCGRDDLFITFTGNPGWREIVENLRAGETWIDRPDLVCRVFALKAAEFLKDIIGKNRGVLGKVKAFKLALEHQKRGMPHLHILLTMTKKFKLLTPAEVDDILRSEIPEYPAHNDPHYHAKLRYFHNTLGYMVHDPSRCPAICGMDHTGKLCRKGFPKRWCAGTCIRGDGYAQTRRRDDGRTVTIKRSNGRRVDITNQYIVTHNRYLILKYNCHINIEHCGGSGALKYLHKYLHKGFDKAFISVREKLKAGQKHQGNARSAAAPSSTDPNTVDFNEFHQFRLLRVLGACEAAAKLLKLPLTKQSHIVTELPVHLLDEHNIVFDEKDEPEKILAKTQNDGTQANKPAVSMLTAFFKLVQSELNNPKIDKDDQTRAPNLYYHQVVDKYFYHSKRKQWLRRKKNMNTIGRLQSIAPSNVERFCLRELLKNIKGPTCYNDLKLKPGKTNEWYSTFREAAVAYGLYIGDEICYNILSEVADYASARECRQTFAMLLIHHQPDNAQKLWDDFQNIFLDRGLLPIDEKIRRARAHVASILFYHNKSFKDFNMEDVTHDDLMDAINDTFSNIVPDGDARYDIMNPLQKNFVRAVLASFNNLSNKSRDRLFFLQAPGGTGKTFTFNTIARILRQRGLKVITVASTGIAAILLDGGQTAHSAFRIPLDTGENPNISAQSELAKMIREANCIIWDEAPMQHKSVLERVNYIIRELAGIENHQSLFGNKTMILGGDFKQLLPVMKKQQPRAAYEASILCSDLFRDNFKIYTLTLNQRAVLDPTYAAWLNDVSNGLWTTTFGPNMLQLPTDIVEYNRDAVINFVYPQTIFDVDLTDDETMEAYINQVKDLALLAPINVNVDELNDTINSRLLGEAQTYVAINTMPTDAYIGDFEFGNDYNSDELNLFEDPSIPPHALSLKIGSVVMLSRNISTHLGLCNGTRMVVKKLYESHIKCQITTGDHAGEIHSIFPISNMYSNIDAEVEFPSFSRFQLPIRPAFAITINKSQGQTVGRVGLMLDSQCFAHGQLYVALSRVRSREDIKVYVGPQFIGTHNGARIAHATNIVFPEVLRTIQVLTVDVQTLPPPPQQQQQPYSPLSSQWPVDPNASQLQHQQQPYSPLSSQWPSSQQQPAIVTQSTQQPTQGSSVLPRIRLLPQSQQSQSSSTLAASQHSPPNTPPPLSWRSFPSPSNFMYESPLSSQRIWNWSSQSAAAASSVSTSQHIPPYAPSPASFLSPSPAPSLQAAQHLTPITPSPASFLSPSPAPSLQAAQNLAPITPSPASFLSPSPAPSLQAAQHLTPITPSPASFLSPSPVPVLSPTNVSHVSSLNFNDLDLSSRQSPQSPWRWPSSPEHSASPSTTEEEEDV